MTPAAVQRTVAPGSLPRRTHWLRPSRVEVFALIINLYGALLFIPGIQAVRPVIRAVPYLSSLVFLVLFLKRHTRPKLPVGGRMVKLALILLALNLAHPYTAPVAGLAQVIFQLSIAAPVFWVNRVVSGEDQLRRLLWLTFVCNALGALVGCLQIYYPGYFMPPEFSSLALSINPYAVSSRTHIGAQGWEIIRPPGLSDLPGGAAVSAMMAGVLGIALGTERAQSTLRRLFSLTLAVVGMFTLYLTHVRSFFLMMLVALVILGLLLIRQGRRAQTARLLALSAVLVMASFWWAISVGGEVIYNRFFGLAQEGVVSSYQTNRGHFVQYTLTELLYEYPFGAGLGRWGMMAVYFGKVGPPSLPPIHVEIQITGWLLDGGALMWLLYGGAICAALRFAFRTAAVNSRAALPYFAGIVFSCCLMIVGIAMAGPAFNMHLGIQFWLMATALYGAARPCVQPGQGKNEPHQTVPRRG